MLKIIRASRLVLGPVVWILKIALVKELTSLLRPETILASSSVPSSSSLFVEKLTIPIFNLSLFSKRLVIKVFAALKINSFLVFPWFKNYYAI